MINSIILVQLFFFLPSDLSEISTHNISLCLPVFLGSSTFGLLEGNKHANFPLTSTIEEGVISLEASRKPLLTRFFFSLCGGQRSRI